MTSRSHVLQLFGSLIAAAVIVIVTILIVTANLGPTDLEEVEERGDRQEERSDRDGDDDD